MQDTLIPDKASLRPDEARAILGCSYQHIYDLIADGSLQALDIRGKFATKPALRITRESLVKFIEERKI